jgi:tRNA-dihydrouridine synthase B
MLGSLTFDNDLLIAPLMDVTTPSFVMLRNLYGGVGSYVMPMVFINQIVAAPKTIIPIAEFVEKVRPSGIQICGSGRSSEHIKIAVEILNSYSFDFLDINSGCPARHTCRSGGGASLLQSHRFNDYRNFIKNTVKYSNKPVSVKIRTGWDSTEMLKGIVRMIEEENAEFLTVHGRLAKQGYSGIVDLRSIKNVKNWVDIPVVGNGDVYSYSSYRAMKDFTGVDAVMIGRATMMQPRLFSIIHKSSKAEEYGDSLFEDESMSSAEFSPSYREKKEHYNTFESIKESITHLLGIIETLGDYWNNDRYKTAEVRRNIIWMLKGMKNGHKARERVGKSKDLTEILDFIHSQEFKTLPKKSKNK